MGRRFFVFLLVVFVCSVVYWLAQDPPRTFQHTVPPLTEQQWRTWCEAGGGKVWVLNDGLDSKACVDRRNDDSIL